MKGYITKDIEKLVEENSDFRRTLYTGKHLQLVLMSLRPGEDIGEEVHADNDQFFRVEQGNGEVRIDGVASKIGKDHAIIVPAGARHNIVNTGSEALRLYTLYGPAKHHDGVIRATKADALAPAMAEEFDGVTTE
jgi:mannose-6-phosphate isomerase-like protein (cupin superfamily)